MSQNGNYTNIWALDKDIKELKKEIRNLKISLLFLAVSFIMFDFLFSIQSYKQTKRLDAHKEVIELQQKQINQLIIHCEYERNKKE